jgi:hypothetical protein
VERLICAPTGRNKATPRRSIADMTGRYREAKVGTPDTALVIFFRLNSKAAKFEFLAPSHPPVQKQKIHKKEGG